MGAVADKKHDVVAIANELSRLRLAKRSEEAAELLTEDATMEVPALFGSEEKKGKAKILKKWKEEDKDGLKLLRSEDFKEVKPNVVTRKVTGEKFFLEITAQQTVWFNAAGKITRLQIKKL